MRTHKLHLLLACSLPPALPAQDMIAVGWSGTVYALDSFAGTATSIGAGSYGQNALAIDGAGGVWCTQRSQGTPYVYDLTTVDPLTGATTVRLPGVDIRGLAGTNSPLLFAVLEGGDTLATIDTLTGTITRIGTIGFASIQALAFHRGTLYAWDITAGLLRVDVVTGAGTRVNPAAGTSNAGIQFLASRSDGKLIGGQNNLYELDPVSGVATQIGSFGNLDLRGGDEYFGWAQPFGTGCAGAGGVVTLTVTGSPTPGGMLTTTSDNHAPGLGAVLLGFSNTVAGGLPLPLNVDPLLGTSGCSLYVSPDFSAIAVITSSNLVYPIPVPTTVHNLTFFTQHAGFEPVPGNLSLSNGAAVHIGW